MGLGQQNNYRSWRQTLRGIPRETRLTIYANARMNIFHGFLLAIAYHTHYAIGRGEMAAPEAYVPLPDGRNIPARLH